MRYLLALFVIIPCLASAQGFPVTGRTIVQQGASQVAILPPVGGVGERNTAGWNTGYSVVTSSRERANPLGGVWGGSDTVVETVTKVVPNDALGRPMRGGIRPFEEPNSAGWSTGYSAVTSTYERPDPFGAALGGSKTVTETTTRIVPNDALGNPLQPILPLWP